MDEAFIDLRANTVEGTGGETFWPSFTDVMMVVVMIFMMASTVLVIRNSDLVQELRATLKAERHAEEMARSMTETSATLEEQLAQAQHLNSELRMQLMRADENRQTMEKQLADQGQRLLTLTEEQQQLAASLQESRRNEQDKADRLAKVSADYEQLTTSHAGLQERMQQALDQLAASEQTGREQAVELAGLKEAYALSTRQMGTLQEDYDVLRVKYDKLIQPARSAVGKHVVTVRYWKENGQYHLEIKDTNDADYSVVSRKELDRRLARLKEDYSGNLYVKLIIPDNSGLSYNEAWGFTKDILDKYDYYNQK